MNNTSVEIKPTPLPKKLLFTDPEVTRLSPAAQLQIAEALISLPGHEDGSLRLLLHHTKN